MYCLHDLTNVRKLCRICLTDGSTNISLENAFQRSGEDSPSIFCALEKVMCTKLELDENYPSVICPNCLSLLKVSYDLRRRFQNSQKILKEHLTKCLEDMEENDSVLECTAVEENDLLTPKIQEHLENNENVEYIYEENIEKFEEYFKMEQENVQQSEEESELSPTDYVEEYNESNDRIISNSIQTNPTYYKKNKELQIKQLDIDKYIIEKPAEGNSDIADHSFKNLSSLDEELIQAAYNLKYECPGCPKIYSTLKNLNKHKEVCVKLKQIVQSQILTINEKSEDLDLFEEDYLLPYECNQCFKCYLSPDELDHHKELVHSELKLNVYQEFKLEDLSELDQELFKGALLLKYECATCPKVYSSSDKLEKHKVICEKLKRTSLRKAKARMTPTRPDGEAQLIDEVRLENLSQAEKDMFQSALSLQRKCPNCGKLYLTEDRFKRHLMNCEPKELSLDLYSCEICGHISTSKKSDLYHKQTVHEERKYACEKCGKLFALKGVLKQHMQSHAKNETKVVCPICGKSFHYTGGLFYHMKMHKKELNYLCDYCDRRFINLNALKRHLATHTGERHYQCKTCSKRFKGNAELRMHELRHTNHRPHRCDYCDKSYASKSNLQFHIITHKGSVACDWCDRKFIDSKVLQLHRKIKHKVHEEDPLFVS